MPFLGLALLHFWLLTEWVSFSDGFFVGSDADTNDDDDLQCSLLEASLPVKILSLGTSNYTTVNNDYWCMFVAFPGLILNYLTP